VGAVAEAAELLPGQEKCPEREAGPAAARAVAGELPAGLAGPGEVAVAEVVAEAERAEERVAAVAVQQLAEAASAQPLED
jgi:hypothetical protein